MLAPFGKLAAFGGRASRKGGGREGCHEIMLAAFGELAAFGGRGLRKGGRREGCHEKMLAAFGELAAFGGRGLRKGEQIDGSFVHIYIVGRAGKLNFLRRCAEGYPLARSGCQAFRLAAYWSGVMCGWYSSGMCPVTAAGVKKIKQESSTTVLEEAA